MKTRKKTTRRERTMLRACRDYEQRLTELYDLRERQTEELKQIREVLGLPLEAGRAAVFNEIRARRLGDLCGGCARADLLALIKDFQSQRDFVRKIQKVASDKYNSVAAGASSVVWERAADFLQDVVRRNWPDGVNGASAVPQESEILRK